MQTRLHVLALAFAAGCAPDDTAAARADARVYIESLCEDRRDKCDECAPVPDSWASSCDYTLCVDDALADLAGGFPCFEESHEFARCRLERLECADYYVMDIDTSPGSVCFEPHVRIAECFTALGEGG